MLRDPSSCTRMNLAYVSAIVFMLMSLSSSGANAVDRRAAGNDKWSDHPENVWVKQSPREGAPAPKFGWEGRGAYDPRHDVWIHFGGHDGIPQGNHLFVYDLKSGLWRQKFPNTSPPGVCCVDGSNPFDAANGWFVAFPGASLGHGWQWSRSEFLKQSNAWLYDSESDQWTNRRPPPYRAPEKYSRDVIGGICSGGTYDPAHEIAIAFGGTGAGGATNALFVYDAYANRFEQLRASNPPSQRDGMGLAYDSKHDCLVMFGSQYLNDEQTWIYRFGTNRWEAHALDPHPPAKKTGTYSTIPRMAYDSIHDVMVCLVWLGEEGGHETWSFDLDKMRWTKLNPATEPEPSKSRSRNLSFSPEHNLFLLETMAVSGEPQIWTYRLKKAGPDQHAAPPTNLKLDTQSGQAIISWSASPSPGVQAYQVYRAETDCAWKADWKKLATTAETRFEDKGLTPGQLHFYAVKAVGPGGAESNAGGTVRTQPRVPAQPVVSVPASDKIEVSWSAHPAPDVVGYNIYRGLATVAAVRRGEPAAWRDNDPEYPEPVVTGVKDITGIRKLNDKPLTETSFSDTAVDLTKRGPESGDYKYAVYAYVIRAVNRLGTESGPSPYALTIPAAPQHVMLRETDNRGAELKWDPNPEKGVTGYRVYKIGKSHWQIVRVTEEPIQANTFRHSAGGEQTRYWIVAVDRLGQEGEPSSPVWYNHKYVGFYSGEWHQ